VKRQNRMSFRAQRGISFTINALRIPRSTRASAEAPQDCGLPASGSQSEPSSRPPTRFDGRLRPAATGLRRAKGVSPSQESVRSCERIGPGRFGTVSQELDSPYFLGNWRAELPRRRVKNAGNDYFTASQEVLEIPLGGRVSSRAAAAGSSLLSRGRDGGEPAVLGVNKTLAPTGDWEYP
jgi:hypothetical protein